MKATDGDVRSASVLLEAGETQDAVASVLGITPRALRLRLSALGLPSGQRGRPRVPRMKHCPTCRCVAAVGAAQHGEAGTGEGR